MLACSLSPGFVTLWDTRTKAVGAKLGRAAAFSGLQWCPASAYPYLLAAKQRFRNGGKEVLSVWDIRKGEDSWRVEPRRGRACCFCWAAPEPRLWVGTSLGDLECWQLSPSEGAGSLAFQGSWGVTDGRPVSQAASRRDGSQLWVVAGPAEQRSDCWAVHAVSAACPEAPQLLWESPARVVGLRAGAGLLALSADGQLRVAAPHRATPPHRPLLAAGNMRDIFESNEGIERRLRLIRAKPVAADEARPSVVGPVSFAALIDRDFVALVSHLNGNPSDGLKINGIDNFTRRIFLELLIPAMDSHSFTSKSRSHSFSSYYKADDLAKFHSQGVCSKSIELVLCFPMKYSKFWFPTFVLESKNGYEFDEESTPNDIVEELSLMTQRHADALADGEEGEGEGLLVQLARCFRRRVQQAWERRLDSEKQSISYGSLIQSLEGSLAGSSQLLTDSQLADLDTHCLEGVEDQAFIVPFPVCAAGVFDARGHLLCFGKARLVLEPLPPAPKNPDVAPAETKGRPGRVDSDYSLTSQQLSGPDPSCARHVSYANLLVKRILQDRVQGAWAGLSKSSSCATFPGQTRADEAGDQESKDDGSVGSEYFEAQPLSFSLLEGAVPAFVEDEEAARGEPCEPPRPSPPLQARWPRGPTESHSPEPPRPSKAHVASKIRLFRVCYRVELQLAELYRVGPAWASSSGPGDLAEQLRRSAETCLANSAAACAAGAAGPGRLWCLLAAALELFRGRASGDLLCWHSSSCGRSLLASLLRAVLGLRDLQTAALVAAALGGGEAVLRLLGDDAWAGLGGFLDEALAAYSQLLLRWGLRVKGLQVAKFLEPGFAAALAPCGSAAQWSVVARCGSCGELGDACRDCGGTALECCLCLLPVRRGYSFCGACGHGGHLHHMQSWFEAGRDECPAGCGCLCSAGPRAEDSPPPSAPPVGMDYLVFFGDDTRFEYAESQNSDY
eukprot:CAMPEP_0170132396 /NCGR_PEP_ID=MMETSP0020_2-20130122/23834_1 /TAXON_ID=98059 /ORGANISM="Dinobryon sp., Strain UTEXLB2267" /LENGTH=956 /DNA_ID=CAMNT_0010367685 /DNA_START=335 /DNA_END=3205 /DNA_ORIENTATION=-